MGLSSQAIANPTLLKDIATEPLAEGSNPRNFVEVNGVLYFTATTRQSKNGLWANDGLNTWLVANLPGIGLTHGFNSLTAVVDDVLYFAAKGIDATGAHVGEELFKLDENGMSLVADIYPGAFGSQPRDLTVLGDAFYFSARGADAGREIWKYDADADGLTLATDIISGGGSSSPNQLTVVGDALYFTASDNGRGELFKIDAGVVSKVEINRQGPSYTENLTAVGDTLYFTARGRFGPGGDSAQGLFKHGVYGLNLVALYPGSFSRPRNYTAVGDSLYFIAESTDAGTEIWKHDSGVLSVLDINQGPGSSYPDNLTMVGDALYFSAGNSVSGIELYRDDANGTALVADLYEGGSSYPDQLTVFGDVLYFSAFGNNSTDGNVGNKLYKLDENGLSVVDGGSGPADLTMVGDVLYFSAWGATNTAGDDLGRELWKYDNSGASLVVDTYPGADSSHPRNITAVGYC